MRKDISLKKFLIQMKMPYSGGEKMPQRTFMSKAKRHAPGLKAGKVKVSCTVLSNAAEFMIRMPLSINLLTPEHWREKINTSCQFGCTTRCGQ